MQYNPGPPSAAALLEFEGVTDRDLEFLEITNFQSESVDLTDWRIGGGIDFEFAAGTELAPSQSLVVLPFNPANPRNVGRLDAFVAHYSVDESVVLIGGFQGQLSDSEDRILLQSPDASGGNDVAHIVADDVLYDDLSPWPENADGTGFSIHRGEPGVHGSDSTIWIGLAPTPGVTSMVDPVTGDFDNDGALGEGDIILFCAGFRINNLEFDINRDGKVDGVDRQILIFDLFGSTYGDSNLDGVFNSGDLTVIFQHGEYEDATAGNSTWSEGDWDCDGDFTTRDFVLAFQQQSGGFAATAYDPPPAADVIASAISRDAQGNHVADERIDLDSESTLPTQDRLNPLSDIHVDSFLEIDDEEFHIAEPSRELGSESADEFSNRK